MTSFWLEDTRRVDANGLDNANLSGNFLGSLWGLDPVQRWVPSPFLEYRVVSSVGLGIAYDQARVKTLDWADQANQITAGDGDLQVRGLQAYLVGRLRIGGRISAQAHAGRGFYHSEFFASPGWLAPGRRFVVADTSGWLVSAGGTVSVVRHFGLEASYRHSWTADVDARAYLRPNKYREGSFPMRSDAVSVGAAYSF